MNKNILVSPQDVRTLAEDIVNFMYGDTVEDYFCDKDEAIDDIVNDIENRPEELIAKLAESEGADKFVERVKATREPKKPAMFVIKDKAGRQVSAPNPDDSELWSRVEAMEARGQKGLKVVAYVEECLTEELTDEQEDKIEIAKRLIDDLEEILEDGKGKLGGIKRLFGQLGIHSADIDPYFTNYLDGFISDENEMSCEELRGRIQEFIDENKVEESVKPVVESSNDNTLINCYYSVDTGVDYYDDLTREEAIEKATEAKNSSDIEYIYVTRTDTYSNGRKEYEVVVDASRIETDEPWTILTDGLKIFEVAEQLEEHIAIDTHDQLNPDEIKPVIEVEPLNESAEREARFRVGCVEGNPESYDKLDEVFFILSDEEEAISFAKSVVDKEAEKYEGSSIVVLKVPYDAENEHSSEYEIFRSFVAGKIEEGFLGDDYKVFCQCNDGPQKLITLVAQNDEDAIKFAKNMYASEVSVYADDRENDWKCYIVNKTVCEALTDDDALNVETEDEPKLDEAEILTESGWAENHYTMSPAKQEKLEAIFDAGMWEDFEDAVYEACDIITGIHTDELEIENNAARTEGPYITDEQIKEAKKTFYKLCDEWFAKIGKTESLEESIMEEAVLDDAIKTLEKGGILSCDRSGKYFISENEDSLGKAIKAEDAEKILEDDRLVPYGGTDLTTTYKFSTLTEALGIANLQMFLDDIEVDTSSVSTTGEVIIKCKSEDELNRARRVLHKCRIPVEFEKGMTIYVDADRVYPAGDGRLDEEVETEECAWCGHFFKPSELKDTDFGKICPLCGEETSVQVALDDLDDDMSESFQDDWNDKIMQSALAHKDDTSDKKYNIGSNKVVDVNSPEYSRLQELAKMLEEKSPNGFRYRVEKTYEDFGAGMQWYTIICYNRKGDSWQTMNTKQWLDLANEDKTVEETYNDMITGDFWQDKVRDAKDIAEMEDAIRYFDSLDD